MVRVLSRTASVGRPTSALSIVQKRTKKPTYKVQYEQVLAKKRKLNTSNTQITQPAPGYTFLSVGYADLADHCKELSRQRGADVRIVSRKSITPSNSHKVSAYLHRIGYHFHSGIFDEACNVLGYRSRGGKLVRESDEPNSGFARVMARYGAQFDELSERQPMANEEIKVKKAIRELFPRIPDHSLNDIFQTAWKEGATTIGNEGRLPLSRRVQLATGAHIRHVYTEYDKLLRLMTWADARREVESRCLEKIVEWRGDLEENDDEVEEILRETIILDDETDEEYDSDDGDTAGSSDTSYEIVTHDAGAEEIRTEKVSFQFKERHAPHLMQPQATTAAPKHAKQSAILQSRWQDACMQFRGATGPSRYQEPAPYEDTEATHITVPTSRNGKAPRKIVQDGISYVRLSPDREVAGMAREYAAPRPPLTPAYPKIDVDYDSTVPGGYRASALSGNVAAFPQSGNRVYPPLLLAPPNDPQRLERVVESIEETSDEQCCMLRRLSPQQGQYIDLTSSSRHSGEQRTDGFRHVASVQPAPLAHRQHPRYNNDSREESDYEPTHNVVDLTSRYSLTHQSHEEIKYVNSPTSRDSIYHRQLPYIPVEDDEYDPAHPALLLGPPPQQPQYVREQPRFREPAFQTIAQVQRSTHSEQTTYPRHGAPSFVQPATAYHSSEYGGRHMEQIPFGATSSPLRYFVQDVSDARPTYNYHTR